MKQFLILGKCDGSPKEEASRYLPNRIGFSSWCDGSPSGFANHSFTKVWEKGAVQESFPKHLEEPVDPYEGKRL